MIVSPYKLSEVRELVDEWVSERSIVSRQRRLLALTSFAHQFDQEMTFFKVDSWYAASVWRRDGMHEVELYGVNADFDRAAIADIELRTEQLYVAATPETAGLAGAVRLLDCDADVFMSDEELALLYPGDHRPSGRQIAGAIAEFISQQLWFGDVPQFGVAIDRHEMGMSWDGHWWHDGYGEPLACSRGR